MKIALALVSALLGVFGFVSAVVIPIGAFLGSRAMVLRAQPGHVSATPILGTVTATIAVLVAPVATLGARLRWSWVPLAVEVAVNALLAAVWYASGLNARAIQLREQDARCREAQSPAELE